MDYTIFVKNLRERLGWTQRQLADFLGIKRATVGHYETGLIKPSLEVFIKLQRLEFNFNNKLIHQYRCGEEYHNKKGKSHGQRNY
jgi:transcriptional regulator with XRE-family HTH domain